MAQNSKPSELPVPDEPRRRARDRYWAARLRVGDERALADIFEAYYLPLSRYAHSIVQSWDVALDVAADVFNVLWVKRADLDPVDLKAYLLTATRNRALDAERHRQVEEAAAAELATSGWTSESPGAVSPGIEEALVAEEEARGRAAAIDRAYAALPPGTRAVFKEWAKGRSYREIGLAFGIAIKTVDAHVQKAKRIFREVFGREQ